MNTSLYPQTQSSLEYAAILSGLSMAGDIISDSDIEQARDIHVKRNHDSTIAFTLVSPSKAAKR